MDQYIGKMLDNRYEILECIGTGGMAVVYKARCHRLNRLVAVKILKPELASDAEFRRRFHDESQAVAMLSHTNIVTVYDVSRSDDLNYIVMELVDGMTLKQYMKKRGAPLNWREALHFITQITRALSHAHSRGIVHRDIKPQNIMVLRDGSVKVTDFGIARVTSAAQSTLTQEALGSVHYISPEQARGSHIDGRSDLYSAGVVLYEMLTGRLPFEGETPVSVAIQHINSIPIPPRDLNPSIPPALEAITLKAMAPNPEDRYASADVMLYDLEEFRKDPDAVPPYARPVDEGGLEEPTRVVSVSEIKQAEQQNRTSRESGRVDTSGQRRRSHAPERENYYDDDYDDEPRRGVPPIVFAVLAILVFVGGIVFLVYRFFFSSPTAQEPKEIEVPNLMEYTWAELEENPSYYEGFTLADPEFVQSEDYEDGTILNQDPVAGTMVEEGAETVISLLVSAKEELITVPDFTSTPTLWTNAMNELKELGLVPVESKENSDDVDVDYVIRTVPAAGEALRPGDTISVIVSQGKKKETVIVPPLTGVDYEQAKKMLLQAGLTLGDVSTVPSDEDEGTVTWQSLAYNTEVERGTSINLYVSRGPEESPSPEPSESESEPPAVSESEPPVESESEPPVESESEPLISEPPSESPEESGSPDARPSETAAIAVSKTITVDLKPFSDVESVQITVKVGGVSAFDSPVRTDQGSYQVHVMGTGKQLVQIYADNLLIDAEEIDFSA